MNTKNTQGLKLSFDQIQSESTNKKSQLETIFNYLQNNIATATMVHVATGIPRPNITRYKRELEKKELLAEVKKGYCQITNHMAWYLTTDKNNFPVNNQINLF